MTGKGRFVWYDLMTTDVDAAKAFYTEVIGWKVHVWEEGETPYVMWCVGDQPIGGVMRLPEEAKQKGAAPHWMAYVQVPDIEASTQQVESLGGEVLDGPRHIPQVGRFTVFGDPTGAVLALFTPETEMPVGGVPPQAGDVSWHELNTTDWQAASEFYCKLLGWEMDSQMEIPDVGTYWMFKHPETGRALGGMSNAAKVMGAPPNWLYYVTVDDLDKSLTRVEQMGGKVENGPMEVPGGDLVAQCQDPQGIPFALHWIKK